VHVPSSVLIVLLPVSVPPLVYTLAQTSECVRYVVLRALRGPGLGRAPTCYLKRGWVFLKRKRILS